MIEARRTSLWRSDDELIADGRQVATWTGSAWTSGGTLEPTGRRCAVRATPWGSTDGMVDEGGTRLPLAVAVFVLAVVLTTWDSDAAAGG